MTNSKKQHLTVTLPQHSSLILKDCARLTAEHDRMTASYRDLMLRLEQSIFKHGK
jgi:hypothetical protein